MQIKTAAFIGGNAPKDYQSHKRRGQCFWRKVIKEFNESPLSLKAFCSERTLAVSTFQGWRRRLPSAKALSQNELKLDLPSLIEPPKDRVLREDGLRYIS